MIIIATLFRLPGLDARPLGKIPPTLLAFHRYDHFCYMSSACTALARHDLYESHATYIDFKSMSATFIATNSDASREKHTASPISAFHFAGHFRRSPALGRLLSTARSKEARRYCRRCLAPRRWPYGATIHGQLPLTMPPKRIRIPARKDIGRPRDWR